MHAGHLAFARAAIGQCGLDKVFFLVEPRPRRKQGVKAFEHRVNMVNLAISDEPAMGTVMLEQQRFTPTDTLPVLLERFQNAELYMLMGEDWLDHFAAWPHVEDLTKQMRFIIGLKHHSEAEIDQTIKLLQQTKGLKLRYQICRVNQPDYASTRIKQALRRGQTPEGLSPRVLEYIYQEGLYASASGSK